jgi:Mn2+/Fe2+ NRAMP family transporter
VPGSLNDSFSRSKTFYLIFVVQLVMAGAVALFPQVSLFKIIIATQVISAFTLPPIFYYLLQLTSNPAIMGEHTNNAFQRNFTLGGAVVISLASLFTLAAVFLKW